MAIHGVTIAAILRDNKQLFLVMRKGDILKITARREPLKFVFAAHTFIQGVPDDAIAFVDHDRIPNCAIAFASGFIME